MNNIYRVNEWDLPKVLVKIEKLNKKLAKFGEELSIIGQRKVEVIETINNRKYTQEKIELVFSDIKQTRVNDIAYMGTVSFRQNITSIYSVNNEINLTDIASSPSLVCDHCNTKRNRLSYHIFNNKGTIQTIGNTCAKEFFGLDIESVVRLREGFTNDCREFTNSERPYDIYHIDDVIMATFYATHGGNDYWVSGTTSRSVHYFLNGRCDNYDEAKSYREYISNFNPVKLINIKMKLKDFLSNTDSADSNFNFNICSAMTSENGLKTNIVQKAVGISAWFIHKSLKEEIPKKGNIQINSSYVGQIKNKIDFKCEVVKVSSFESMYGYQVVATFVDEHGNYFKAFTSEGSKAGEYLMDDRSSKKITLTGTVKKHEIDTYIQKDNKVKVTTLTRIKIK
ncbi:MAG: hypothetical protein PF569_09235 [Candidatus Woesearchaeota archaeon]|jgi:hypothetical protein|nr:hypothetical protein [Candidatus Woesearchaeota archaeon]